jgi:pimeloyl-ACP methyl ester carboxylesterase
VVAYDRAGLGWSAKASCSRSAGQFIAELDVVVQSTGAPVILVAHSFGALLARLYAATHPHRVAGLVLVDPALTAEWAAPSPDRLRALARGVRLSRRGAALAYFGIVRFGLLLATAGFGATAKLVTRVSSDRGGSAAISRLAGEVRKLPAEVLPVIASHWSRPQGFRSMAEHLTALPEVAAAAAGVTDLGNLPLVVISGSHLRPEQQLEHQRVARTSTRGRHAIAQGSGHWVHVDAPEVIVDAVQSLLSEHHR